MSRIFRDDDHDRIAAAIRSVEAETSGEIVCVVARQCEPYQIIAIMWALLAGLLAGVAVSPLWTEMPAFYLVIGQTLVTGLMLLALQYMPLRMALVPRVVRHRRAHRLARTQFLEQGLHKTVGRNGILIFCAMAEHYVEIIADEGINDQVDAAVWDAAISDFTGLMRRGDMVSAFEGAISSCGSLLKTHAPRPATNPNELPDHLIEI